MFLLNQKDLESKTILPKIFCNMHIAHRNMHVGYHTRKITLPVIPLTVPVTLPIPVMYFLRGTLPVQVLQKQDP